MFDPSLLDDYALESGSYWLPREIRQPLFGSRIIFDKFTGQSACPVFEPRRGEEDEDFKYIESMLAKKKTLFQTAKSKTARTAAKAKRAPLKSSFVPKSKKEQKRFFRQKTYQRTKFKDSVQVKSDWDFVGDYHRSDQSKVGLDMKEFRVELLETVGSVPRLNSALIQGIRPKKKLRLQLAGSEKDQDSIWSDQFLEAKIREIAEDGDKSRRRVLGLDKFLLPLMCFRTSVFPWDLTFFKEGNTIIVSRLDDEDRNCYLELQTYMENNTENMPEEERELVELCETNTSITESYQKQLKLEDERELRYVRLDLGDIEVYTRVAVDAEDDQGRECLLRAISEIETIGFWKEMSLGSIQAEQYNKNTHSLQKWLCQAYLTEVRLIKLGFISRDQESEFNIMEVEQTTTASIMKNLSYDMKDSLNELRLILNWVFAREDGEYVCLKVPYKSQLKFYRLPESAADEEDED